MRSQLESHPRREVVENDPWSDEAQEITADVLRHSRPDPEFTRIRESLAADNQRDAGVVTRRVFSSTRIRVWLRFVTSKASPSKTSPPCSWIACSAHESRKIRYGK
jgi:hypothetical protein